ncbi:MAG: hypothetical protein JOZ14_13565 [Acidobacteria bacterium]|nr:hypothetical protein [Acidobacteriota bacterium]
MIRSEPPALSENNAPGLVLLLTVRGLRRLLETSLEPPRNKDTPNRNWKFKVAIRLSQAMLLRFPALLHAEIRAPLNGPVAI